MRTHTKCHLCPAGLHILHNPNNPTEIKIGALHKPGQRQFWGAFAQTECGLDDGRVN